MGQDWEDGTAYAYTGLRSALHEFASMESAGCMGNKTLGDGTEVLGINTEAMLSVEQETAYFLLDEELPRLLERHDNPRYAPTEAYFHYVSLGLISVKAGQEGEIDTMLRRANWKIRQGVHGQIDPRTLMERSVSAAEAGKSRSRNGVVRPRAVARSRSEAFAALDVAQVPDIPERPVHLHRQRG